LGHRSLFDPIQIKSLQLKNRVVMAPMTRYFAPDGIPSDEVAAYYRRRAEAEVGLIISEATGIERPAAVPDPSVPRIYGDLPLAGWRKVLDEIHTAGGKMACQLWHVGGTQPRSAAWSPPTQQETPSGLLRRDERFGEVMTDAAIADTISAFAAGALNAKAVGFDAVELHAAHGYLIDQFFWHETNVRDDAYGAKNLPGRARFAADILRAVRGAVGEDYPVIVRISQFKGQDFNAKLADNPQVLAAWLKVLSDAGADAFHCSQRRFWTPEFEGSDLSFAGWVKKVSGLTTITVGSVGLSGDFVNAGRGDTSEPVGLEELQRRLDRAEFDLVAVGRALLQDPQWLLKIKTGAHADLRSYDPRVRDILR
jgi:2,4-dienoyl-CoA reductase-like NADH-dependent reductase (Old Yellow Enzyme family)